MLFLLQLTITMTDFFIGIFNSAKDFFNKYFIIITIILGIGLLFWGIEQNTDTKVGKILYTLGSLSLSGGIFAGVAKSAQFTDIYKKIFREIIFGEEHLEKREDLEKIWGNVTRTLSKKKFSKISDELHNNIKKYFLPMNHDYYYENFNIDVIIEYDETDKDYLIIKESTNFNIVCEDEKLKISNKFCCMIKVDMSNKEATTYQLKKIEINGATDVKHHKKFDKNHLVCEYEKELTGRKIYSVKREDEKKFNLRYNPIKSQIAMWVYKNLKLDITYPKELDIEVRGMGLLNDLSIEDKNNKLLNRKVIEYKGLIYKNQGVLMIFRDDKVS